MVAHSPVAARPVNRPSAGTAFRVIAGLTLRGILGSRRVLLLVALPLVLIGISIVVSLLGGDEVTAAEAVLQAFGLGTVLPLVALIAGTGAIGPEIDDGEIVYLLTKPIPRPLIALTKLAVAVVITAVLTGACGLICGLVLGSGIAAGFAVGATVGAVAYGSVFLALAVITRHAVVIGLLYALVWESLIGGLVPGAQTLSIQQWAYSVAASMLPDNLADPAVRLSVAVPLLAVVTVGAAWLAAWRLRSLTLASDE